MSQVTHALEGQTYHLKMGPKAEDTTPTVGATAEALEKLVTSLKPEDRVYRTSRLSYVVVSAQHG